MMFVPKQKVQNKIRHKRQTSFNSHLELLAKVLRMELVDPLDVAEDDVSLAAQRLRNVFAQQFLHVVFNDVVQRSHIVAFRSDHFPNDQKKRPGRKKKMFEYNQCTRCIALSRKSHFCVF